MDIPWFSYVCSVNVTFPFLVNLNIRVILVLQIFFLPETIYIVLAEKKFDIKRSDFKSYAERLLHRAPDLVHRNA